MTTLEALQEMLCDPARRREYGGYNNLALCKGVQCVDGLKMSVQASRTHYCAPREDYGPWFKVEVGFPNQKVDELLHYAEDPDRPTDTVYGYVPIEIVASVIDAHGGLAGIASAERAADKGGT